MTDEEAKATGLRAVVCGWRWLRGAALGPHGWHVVTEDALAPAAEGLELAHRDGRWSMDPDQVAGVGCFADDGPRWPDFRVPSTVGCLRAQAREALGDPNAHTIWCPTTGGAATPWAMVRTTDGARPGGWHATEVEAMIGALEFAAPACAP